MNNVFKNVVSAQSVINANFYFDEVKVFRQHKTNKNLMNGLY